MKADEYVADTSNAFLRQCRAEKIKRGLDPTLDTTEDFLQTCREDKIRKGFSPVSNRRSV